MNRSLPIHRPGEAALLLLLAACSSAPPVEDVEVFYPSPPSPPRIQFLRSITFKTDVANGLASGKIVGNGTATVTVTATVAKIKATLAATAGLKYLNTAGYTGPDTLVITADDKGNSGAGGWSRWSCQQPLKHWTR